MSSTNYWAVLCVSPGANCTTMSNTNGSAQVRKRIGSGFSGLPNKSTGIAKPEPVSISVHTRLTAIGDRKSGPPAMLECGGESNQAFANLCGGPSRESENERWLELRLNTKERER